jgi:hypothetical protein
MMDDKADLDSGLNVRRNTPLHHWSVPGRRAADQEASRKPWDLNLFEVCMVLEFKWFQHFAGRVRDLINAAAPYFIHIVRANRARDMIGLCAGICQTGQQDKQTVAG